MAKCGAKLVVDDSVDLSMTLCFPSRESLSIKQGVSSPSK